MARTRLSSKGQVIIPKAVRERHGWQPGVELEVEDRGDVVVLRPVRIFPLTTIVSALRPSLRSGSGAIPLPWRGDPE
jgi:AbrB family looped-hinge helix DNA binding protein